MARAGQDGNAVPLEDPTPTGPTVAEGVSAPFVRAVLADPAVVGHAIAGLNFAVHDEHGLTQLLGRAARVAASWFPDADWAGITVVFDRTPFTAAETDPLVLAVDQAQYDAGDGPCLQAVRTRTVITAGPQAAVAAWPVFAARAAAHGVHSFLAAPLLDDTRARGAINVYSRSDTGFAEYDTERMRVLADLVRRGLAEYTAVTAARDHATHLQQALASRAPIEQAKGILMAVHRIDDDAAFALLSTESQQTNTKLHDVAVALVARLTQPDDTSDTDPTPTTPPT